MTIRPPARPLARRRAPQPRARARGRAQAASPSRATTRRWRTSRSRRGVGVGTVYRHFPDKTALVEALVEERFTQFAAAGREALEAEDVWAGFRDWLMHCGEIQAEDRMICDFITEAVGDERRDAIAKATGLREVTSEVIDHAKAAGVLRDDVVQEDIPTIMCGLGAVARVQADPEGRDLAPPARVHAGGHARDHIR